MTVYSSHFFETSPAGFGGNTYTKATVGLGIELPADVLEATERAAPMVGLGIIMDFPFFPDGEEGGQVASPPLLATRRSPRRPQVFSPGSEYAPMRTPSPSLRGGAPLPLSPLADAEPCWGRMAGTLDVPGVDVAALLASWRAYAPHPTAAPGAGLGLGVQGLQDAEIVSTFDVQSTAHAGAIDLSFLDSEEEDEVDELSGMSSGSGSSGSPEPDSDSDVAYHSCLCETAHPKPSRAFMGLGFALHSVDECEGGAGHPAIQASPRESPTLGFDSPFWSTYVSTMNEPVY